MTGFGRGVLQKNGYEVTVEVKSVNHRFRDIRLKMSSRFNQLDIPLRKKIEQKFKRGSFELYVNYKTVTQEVDELEEFKIDEDKLHRFFKKSSTIAKQHGVALQVNPFDFLRSEFTLEVDEKTYEELGTLILEVADTALEDLERSRNEEGAKLKEIMLGHLSAYEKIYCTLEEVTDQYRQGVEAKLQKAFSEVKDKYALEESRFMQEVVYYLEKLDIHEELNRIKSHLSKAHQLFKQGGEIGRQFEFLLQEFNRETNTIGSKSGDSEISNRVVQMKVQLEKMREQALNLV
jgi:uncharacterized protein (TIGR00255 family)